jgi:hypothetical protein
MLQLGRPGFAGEQSVAFAPGDAVTILGFEGENGMFVAGQITNEASGATLHLRDPNGRPLWAGRGQNGQGGQGNGNGQNGQQQNSQSQGQGQEQLGAGQNSSAGIPQTAQNEWVTLSGVIVSVDSQGLLVDTIEQGQQWVDLGPPWFASQQEVTFTPGNEVTIQGFSGDGGLFQAGEITNVTANTTLQLRDPNGRPLWAGGGGHGNATN